MTSQQQQQSDSYDRHVPRGQKLHPISVNQVLRRSRVPLRTVSVP